MKSENIYVVILAGGEGTRFAPYSTPQRPKQFLNITHPHRTMIQETYDRIAGWVPTDHVFVSTNLKYCGLVADQLPDIPASNIIGEPLKKNTAPPIALITAYLHSLNPKACVLFLPSDHYIHQPQLARDCFEEALDQSVEKKRMFVFGVLPTFPSSDYGYIETKAPHDVVRFVEKPTVEKAASYIELGNFFWNSGIFAWEADVFLKEIENHMPEISFLLKDIKLDGKKLNQESILSYFTKAPSISIDYGLMEKSKRVGYVPFNVGWNDVGTWKGLNELIKNFKIDIPPQVKPYL
ncbi:mannose-1-phosphate guanylyltransferase [bacterium]|nr:mannose-1-phosphate guanylyltransferase [bacterium]